ncbi:MAG: type II CRISPR-associated endonuclease Cas1 [archaeon]
MIKRTVYIGNPAHLFVHHEQLKIHQNGQETSSIPIEDLGYLIIDHYGVSVTHGALEQLMENKVSVITTDSNHMPAGIFLPFVGSSIQTLTIAHQIGTSKPIQKSLWQQIVKAKVRNQALLLDHLELPSEFLHHLESKIRTNDETNREAVAAKYYWAILFDPLRFKRHQEGKPPNNLLNYGYAILRAIITRAIVSAGLLPQVGIHHHNQYNAFPLSDDIMEPYRPFVDQIVQKIALEELDISILRPEIKRELLELPSIPVRMKKETKPLMIAASWTAASLQRCFAGKSKKILCPELCG